MLQLWHDKLLIARRLVTLAEKVIAGKAKILKEKENRHLRSADPRQDSAFFSAVPFLVQSSGMVPLDDQTQASQRSDSFY
jgi:hypothetical protein